MGQPGIAGEEGVSAGGRWRKPQKAHVFPNLVLKRGVFRTPRTILREFGFSELEQAAAQFTSYQRQHQQQHSNQFVDAAQTEIPGVLTILRSARSQERPRHQFSGEGRGESCDRGLTRRIADTNKLAETDRQEISPNWSGTSREVQPTWRDS